MDFKLASGLEIGRVSTRETRAMRSNRKECRLIVSPGEDTSRPSRMSMSSGKLKENRKRPRPKDRSRCGGELLRSNPESDAPAAKAVVAPKRNRGRQLPTTGEGVGRAAAKAAMVGAQHIEMEKNAEELTARKVTPTRSTRTSPRLSLESDLESLMGLSITSAECAEMIAREEELDEKLTDCLDTIHHVADRSRNLKVPFKTALNVVADTVQEVFNELRFRCSKRESDALESANNRMQAEIEELRSEAAKLRMELNKVSAAALQPAPRAHPGGSARSSPALEELEQRIARQVGDVVNARLAAIEELFVSEKRVTPPLAPDSSLEAQVPITATENLPRKICFTCLYKVEIASDLHKYSTKNNLYMKSLLGDCVKGRKAVQPKVLLGLITPLKKSLRSSIEKSMTASKDTTQNDENNDSIQNSKRPRISVKSLDVINSSFSSPSKRPRISVKSLDVINSSFSSPSSTQNVESTQKVKSTQKDKSTQKAASTQKVESSHKKRKADDSRTNRNKKQDCDSSSERQQPQPRISPDTNLKRSKTDSKPLNNTENRCDICDKIYSTAKKLYLHRRSHSKKYHCPLDACGKVFATKGDLQKHIRSHTGEKPYKCDLCDKSFTQNGTLKAHKESVHVEKM